MRRSRLMLCVSVVGMLLLAAGPLAIADELAEKSELTEPIFRVTIQDDQVKPVQAVAQAPTNEHPLMPSIRMAQASLARIDADIKDYQCTMVKRENVDGKIGENEYVFLKVRHEPFSVYMFFLGPAPVKGRECLYVAGQNKNKLIAHEGGTGIRNMFPTVQIDPRGFLAMRGQRYPITEIGIRNLTTRLIEVAEEDLKFSECEVKQFKNAKVNGRVCTCLQVVHPVRRANFRYHMARVFMDDALQIPIRFESYDWPSKPGGKPPLLEEYTYMNMKFNNGYTDADFDEENAKYKFK